VFSTKLANGSRAHADINSTGHVHPNNVYSLCAVPILRTMCYLWEILWTSNTN